MKDTEIKRVCCPGADGAQITSEKIGYTNEELGSVPESANLGLGCGNPVALLSLVEGETVLDLGSGAGLDCFLAANRVGKSGEVIGVDMTPEMIDKARENARINEYENVEFRLGEIENIPAADGSVDAVISNCVINLSPDKNRVFNEAFRVLRPGGRLMVSDIVLLKELPESIKNSAAAYAGCVAGAMMREEYLEAVRQAGFQEVKVIDETSFGTDCCSDQTAGAVIDELNLSIASIKVQGMKPGH
jgi:SAM-dependent methyltransferase